jgi:pre-mRNA-processing factor 40
MQPGQQFRPVGQAMPGANIGMPGQMPHFQQPTQHLPHSGQVPPASQAVPMAYQPARPMSSGPLQPPATFPGGHMPTMGGPIPPPSYTASPIFPCTLWILFVHLIYVFNFTKLLPDLECHPLPISY